MAAANSITVPVLPYQNSSGIANVANVACDANKARVWFIALGGSGQSGEQVKPGFLVVDNSSNGSSCYVNLNSFSFSVSPYTRKSFKLPEDSVSMTITVGIGTVNCIISDADLGIPDDTSQYGSLGTAGGLDRAAFDPAHTDAAGTLSNNNYSVVFNKDTSGAVTVGDTWGKTSKSFGKFYFEFYLNYDTSPPPNNNTSGFSGFGIAFGADPTTSLDDSVTGTGMTYVPGATSVFCYLQGKQTAASPRAIASMDFSGGKGKVCIDVDNARFYIAPIGSSLWNGKAGVDPAQPNTGIDVSSAFNFCKQVYFDMWHGNHSQAQENILTINTGGQPFQDNPPPLYTMGW